MDKNSIAPFDSSTILEVQKGMKKNKKKKNKNKTKRTKCGSWLRVAWGLFSEYSDCSTIHGIRYLGDKQRSWVERVWWIVVLCISMALCGVFIFKIYDKWDTSPMIVSFDERSTPNWQIPFPAVTICPETKVNSSMLNITEIYNMIVAGNDSLYNLTEPE
jgi:Amiloride-sensitive sodium channel